MPDIHSHDLRAAVLLVRVGWWVANSGAVEEFSLIGQ